MPSASLALLASALFSAPVLTVMPEQHRAETIEVKRITSILYAKEVEPCVKFWVERLGFQVGPQVPDGNKLGFAIVQKGNVELMYQSYASAAKDSTAGALESLPRGASYLYIEVNDIDKTLAAMKGIELVHPMHATFYGMKEFTVQDPAGHIVIFAQPVSGNGK